MDVLRRCMIRSAKAGLHGSLLPPCFKHIVRLPFHEGHEASYNTLIDVRPPPPS